ncbi:hypothetical protein CTI12_AA571140 [Artemisia annua]|uniref:Uncharacterized protein n=1 Tax=Artemisia annua TaxID=35608 RepID=A0A2U1KS02_ARTAN|nr:hypothetical protein CTI12_AA571140 [Artemisia annua]
MKENQPYLPKNVTTSPTLKLPENNDTIMHQSLDSQLDDIMVVEGQNPSITKREMDFYYASRGGVLSPPPLDFFSPRRRRPARSVVALPEHSLQGDSAVHDAQSSSGSMPFATGTLSVGHETQIGSLSPDGPHIVAQTSDSRAASKKKQRGQPLRNNDACHSFAATQPLSADGCSVTQAPASNATENVVEPPRRGNRRKDCSMPSVADQDVVQPQKRSRCLSEALAQTTGDNGQTSISCTPLTMANLHAGQTQGETTNTAEHHASVRPPHHHLQTIINDSTSHALENASPPYQDIAEPSTSRTPAETANLHATPSVPQSQKRNARPRRTTARHVSSFPRSPKRNAHPRRTAARRPNQQSQNITEGSASNAFENASPPYQDIAEPSTSRTPAETANLHATPSVPQSQKRNARPRRTTARRPNQRSQNITEGSTSHALEDTSSAYEDLGDCTERCMYCNDAFWRGERLAGRSYSAHVSHYHLCCGNDSPPLDPQVVQGLIHFLDTHNELVQMFRTARDKCAEADVPEFKIRLYSGDRPRGYELPSSNTLGAIVFDRGPESESNYDVILEYRDGPLKRISKIHKSYMSLQFPLIFIYGQPGYHTKLMLRTANPDDEPKRVSMNAFYTYQLHPKPVMLQQKAIVCPKNETADIINSTVLDMVAGEEKTYASYDIAIPVGNNVGSSQLPIALPNEQHVDQKKNSLAPQASFTLPNKEIEQDKEIDQMVIQNQETSGSLASPVATANEDSGDQKKDEETSTAILTLPATDIDQGKKMSVMN